MTPDGYGGGLTDDGDFAILGVNVAPDEDEGGGGGRETAAALAATAIVVVVGGITIPARPSGGGARGTCSSTDR